MKRIAILTFTTVLFSLHTNAQITKANWLVGGTGRFSSQKQKEAARYIKGTVLQISPDIGYFPIDKLAIGLKPTLTYDKAQSTGFGSESIALDLGPFVRYYALSVDKRVNAFVQAAYQYSTNFTNHFKSNTFSFSAGPVLYLNSSVGLELTANYDMYRAVASTSRINTFYIAIGFQIHIEKDKDE